MGQPEMAPQSEPRDGVSSVREKMPSSAEQSTLHSCSGKWGPWRVARESVVVSTFLLDALLDI